MVAKKQKTKGAGFPLSQIASMTMPINVVDIVPSPWNKRKIDVQSPQFDEFVADIAVHGVLVPVHVRPMDDGFQLVCGARRWRAAIKAGFDSIPALVHENMDDRAAIELMYKENVRENLTPLEEAAAAAMMLEVYDGDVEAVAGVLGRTPHWVAQHVKVHEGLAGVWRGDVEDVDGIEVRLLLEVFSAWTISHFALLARLPHQVQVDAFDDLSEDHSCAAWTVGRLEDYLEKYHFTLADAPWKLTDKLDGLCPCSECPTRSGAHLLLWEDATDPAKDRCLDKSCWLKKTVAHLKTTYQKLLKKHGRVVLLAFGKAYHVPYEIRDALAAGVTDIFSMDTVSFETRSKSAGGGGVCGLILDGPRIGKIVWVTDGLPEPAAADQRDNGKNDSDAGYRPGDGNPPVDEIDDDNDDEQEKNATPNLSKDAVDAWTQICEAFEAQLEAVDYNAFMDLHGADETIDLLLSMVAAFGIAGDVERRSENLNAFEQLAKVNEKNDFHSLIELLYVKVRERVWEEVDFTWQSSVRQGDLFNLKEAAKLFGIPLPEAPEDAAETAKPRKRGRLKKTA